MALFDVLFDIFTNDESQEAFQNNPEGFLNQNGLSNVTSQDIESEAPRVFAATTGANTSFAESGNVVLPPPPGGGYDGGGYDGGGGLSGAIESINHYTNVFNTTTQNVDDRDTTVDASVNQNVTAFGDVNQDFDTDIVSGDGAVNNEGNNAQINTGDEAIQVGDDVNDSTLNTGNVGGSVTGDNQDSIVGNNNQAIIDSEVGAAAFGGGDATNVEARNANLGDGVQVNDSEDVNVNDGGGDLFDIEGSNIEESQIGGSGNTLQSNDTDIDIDADDGSAVAFGAGSEADAQQQNVDIDDVDGNVQVTGEDGTQLVDQSTNVDIDDSFNQVDQSVNDSYNIDDSLNTDISDDDGVDIDDSFNQNDLSDDDAIDVL